VIHGTHPVPYSVGVGGALSSGQIGRSVKLTSHLHLLPRLKCTNFYLHSSIRFYALVFKLNFVTVKESGYLSQYSVWLWTGRPGFDRRQRQRIFLLVSVSRPALGSTQPPVQWIQWVPEVLSPGIKRGRGVMLTTNPHLVPRLRMSRSYTSSPPRRLHGV
jgi:hypothetical protein